MCTPININRWIEENKSSFQPPVGNKLMHEKQLKVFFVGGPNQRKDFHLEEGEELFYMNHGTMELITLQEGEFKSIVIEEGQIFLLPGRIPHSPQRKEATVGLVIERERAHHELDCLRYYVNESTETLFERWFYCDDLGVQLVPVIKEFFASEQCRTGKPIPGTISPDPPYHPDPIRQTEAPFNLKVWLETNRDEIHRVGVKSLFDPSSYQSTVLVYGKGVNSNIGSDSHEIWLWQLEGQSDIKFEDGKFERLKEDDSLLLPPGRKVVLQQESEDCFVMSVAMPTPTNRL